VYITLQREAKCEDQQRIFLRVRCINGLPDLQLLHVVARHEPRSSIYGRHKVPVLITLSGETDHKMTSKIGEEQSKDDIRGRCLNYSAFSRSNIITIVNETCSLPAATHKYIYLVKIHGTLVIV
jgi:hypothetical protein